jgi:triacylglycerol lipase
MLIPKLRSPIVLVHGLLGYDRICVGGRTLLCYFANIPELLRKFDNRVLVAQLTPTGGVRQRAEELKSFLDREAPAEPVHIIAHSMGGLDSRYMISKLGMAERVLTLTTLGTPHRGSPFANWVVRRFGRVFKPVLEGLGLPYQAFYDLTTARCREFNEEVADAPGVRYFSVVGRHDGGWHSPHWRLPYSVVRAAEGANDGIVSVTSATYGESCETWEGDHLSLINRLNPVALSRGLCQERSADYGGLVRRLADEGF